MRPICDLDFDLRPELSIGHDDSEIIKQGREWAGSHMTLQEIKDAAPGSVLKDDVVKGLQLRVYPSGKRMFLIYYRAGKVERRPSLGEFGQITLAEARKRAKEILNDVDRGLDPSGARQKKRAGLTMQDLFEATYKGHWDKPRFHRSRYDVKARNMWNHILSKEFGNTLASDMTRVKIKEWHQSMADQPGYADNCKAILSRLFSYGNEHGLIEMLNPCDHVKSFPAAKRARYASDDETATIFASLAKFQEKNPHEVAFMRAAFYTGARHVALLRLEWSELQTVELEGVKYLTASIKGKTFHKTNEEDVIVFPPQMVDEILSLPKSQKHDRVFGMYEIKYFWNKIKKDTGIKDLWARDSRRTFATLGFSNGVDKDIVSKLLHHAGNDQMTSLYAKLQINPRLNAVKSIAGVLDSVSQKKKK